MNTVIIGLGSNILPEENIGKAIGELAKSMRLIRQANLIRTKPVGITEQPDFFNGAVLVETGLDLIELKTLLKNLEDALGRDRTKPKYGPRTIDLDIVVWNGKIIDNDYYTRDYLPVLVGELI
jgi:2-amino-4-hydroxy-6-hydroxymethyldihydropteridine diphosphokinase